MSNESEYEERKRQEKACEQEQRAQYESERSEYAYDQWMMGKSYEEARDEFDYRHGY